MPFGPPSDRDDEHRTASAPSNRPSRAAGLSLKGRALRLLTAREHSRVELTRKLAAHAESAEQLQVLLDELEALGYLSAQRVAASVIHRQAPRQGLRRIQQELQTRGLDPAEHREALQALRESEPQRALDLWRRRFDGVSSDPRERARQARFLLARGFSADLVARLVRGEFPDDDRMP